MIPKVNESLLARRIARIEGKKQQVNIAQIQEVLRVTKEVLRDYSAAAILAWLGR